jgi:Protein of unknown function (DUF3987)
MPADLAHLLNLNNLQNQPGRTTVKARRHARYQGERGVMNDMPTIPLTQAQRDALHARGFSDDDILDISPEEAEQIIANISPERAQEILINGGAPLEPDRDQLEIFVQGMLRYCGRDGIVSLRAFYESDSAKPFRITDIKLTGGLPFLIEAAEDDARRAANNPKPVVFCPPIAVFAPTGRAREQDLLEAPVFSVELDQNPRAALATLERLLGPATLPVRSGGVWVNPATGDVEDKLHAHWRLKRPARGEDIAKLKRARQLATALVGGDPSNVPASHPLRWPGSWHRKSAPRLCKIVSTEHVDNEIDVHVALTALEAIAPPPKGSGVLNVAPAFAHLPVVDLGEGIPSALDWSAAFGKIISGEQFHPVLAPLASSFAARAVPEVAARGVLHALLDNTQTTDPERRRRRDTELNKLKETVRSGYEKFAAAITTPTGALFDPWQEFVVPEFPLDVLPTVAREFVLGRSLTMGADRSAVAMSTLAAFSGAIHHRFRMKMMRNGGWWEHVRLWVLLIGRSAWKKSPIIDAATRPLERHQAALMREYRAAMRDYEAKKKAGDEDAEESEPPERFTVGDTTIEKLGEILSRGERGVLAKHDEVAGWIGRMERYHSAGKGASADRAFWLQAWNGGPYSIDRVKSGETFVQNLSVSIVGGIQPARLAEIHGLTSDGLLQRFLPVLMRAPTRPADIDCSDADKNYEALIYELIALPPQQLRTTDAAIDAMAELQNHLFKLEQVGEALSEGFEGFVGKLAGYAGVLAMILHLAANPKEAVKNFIGRPIIEKADRLIRNFLLPHAHQFYGTGEGESERLRKLASYVLTCGKNRLRLAEFTTNVRDCRGKTVLELNRQVSPLVAGGWLAPIEQGPACRAWAVNRATIDAQFAEQCRVEQERKLVIRQLIAAEAQRRRT